MTAALVGHIVEENEELSIDQLCELCAVGRQQVLELVEEGVLETAPGQLRFSGVSLRRLRVATRLQRDLGINVAGVALVIELLERIEVLERDLPGAGFTGQRRGA
ncbi:MAG: chaperone modulator CbpM [Steroidobacteraceae bacterium]